MKILKHPDPILRLKAEPVTVFDMDLKQQLGEIEEFTWGIKTSAGKLVGFAAPQVGISKRMFLVLGTWYINPEIIWLPSAPLKDFKEGCYSLEDGYYDHKTSRHYSVTAKYQDPDGEWHEKRLKGLEAQAFQHELDHLNGILACDHYPTDEKE